MIASMMKASFPNIRRNLADLDNFERRELLELLSSCDPREFAGLAARATTAKVKKILRFYLPLPKERLFEIWAKQKNYGASGARSSVRR